MPGHQPTNAVRAATPARAGGDRRTAQLCRSAAPRRVRADAKRASRSCRSSTPCASSATPGSCRSTTTRTASERQRSSPSETNSSLTARMPSGMYSAGSRSFGAWTFDSSSANAGQDRRHSAIHERREDGHRPACANVAAVGRRMRARTRRARAGWRERRDRRRRAGCRTGSSSSTAAPGGAASSMSLRTSPAISSGSWPGASRSVKFACARRDERRVEDLLAGVDAVDLGRRLGPVRG